MSKYIIFGGFLGAGKTTTMIAMAEYLETKGLRPAILVNYLGAKNLVDGATTDAAGCCCGEITGDCICYQTEALVDRLRRFRDSSGCDIVLSDIPGCGIGALDHVYHRLAKEYPAEFALRPFTAVADPERLRAILPEQAALHLPAEMRYLFDAQLREAEVILLNKIDTLTPEVLAADMEFLLKTYPHAKVFPVSARTGEGIPAAADYLFGAESALPVADIGYGGPEFLAAEQRLSWYNRKFFAKGSDETDGNAFVEALFEAVRAKLKAAGRNVPHLKIFINGKEGFAKASLLGVDYKTEFDSRFAAPQRELRAVINARAACESEVLDFLMDAALRETCEAFGLKCRIFFTECFGMMDEGNE